jgi:hypothetical protein
MYRDRSITKDRLEPRRFQDQSPAAPELARPMAGRVDEGPAPVLAPLARLESMSPAERLRAYRAGVLTRAERSAWAGAFPEEVPLVNDEVEWIGLTAE